MDLAGFLAARLDEDEAAAKAAAGPDWFLDSTEDSDRRSIRYTGPSTLHPGELADYYVADRVDEHDAAHIARHDPARRLREVEAGRKLLALHRRRSTEFIDADGDDRTSYDCSECRNHGLPDSWPCKTLRIGAAVYSDHPDYQQEWKP